MQKVKNKDDKGNPYHDEEGKFASPGDEGQKVPEEGLLDLPQDVSASSSKVQTEEKPKSADILSIKPFDPFDLDMVLATFDNTTEQIESVLTGSAQFMELLHVKDASELTLQDKFDYLSASPNDYDIEKLKNASEQTINALFLSEQIKKAPKLIQQSLILLDKEKEKLTKSEEKEVLLRLEEQTNQSGPLDLSGMWLQTPTLENYEEFSKVGEDGTSRISRKRDYFKDQLEFANKQIASEQEIIDDIFSTVDDIEQSKKNIENYNKYVESLNKKIANLDKFEQFGQIYKQVKEDVAKKFLDQHENVEKEISELKQREKETNSDAYFDLVKVSNQLIGKFQDESAIYSQARKDNAVWFKSGNIIEQAQKHFFPTAEQHFASMTPAEIHIVDRYKSGSSAFNEPLRSMNYTGSKSFGNGASFSKAINDLTSAIDKCMWPDDIWVQRGQSATVNCFVINGVKKSIMSMTEQERQSLIGSMYVDNGFYSAGAGKGTGFSGESLIINTYCPKGTKMVYAQYRPGYKTENEMILQRGYSYRITKIEQKNSRYYMDVEVILNSDQNKPVGSELEQIEKKHYKGY